MSNHTFAIALSLIGGIALSTIGCSDSGDDQGLESREELRDLAARDIWNDLDDATIDSSSPRPVYWPNDLNDDALRAEIPAEEAKAFADIWGVSEADAAERLAFERENVVLAERLMLETSAGFGGVHLRPEDGALVVSVTERATAQDLARIRSAGAIPRVVAYELAELEAAMDELSAASGDVDAAVRLDAEANQVVLVLPLGEEGPAIDALSRLADELGEKVAVSFEDTEVTLAALWGGYEATDTSASSHHCSIAFLARNPINGAVFALTAGHCAENIPSQSQYNLWKKDEWWYEGNSDPGSNTIGPWVNDGNWPYADYAAIYVVSPSSGPAARVRFGPNPPFYSNSEAISGSANVVQNQGLCKSGYTTGTTCGTVTSTSRSWSGGMQNTIETTIWVQPGDSGGALHVAGVGYGITHGITPPSEPYRSFFQKIGPVIGPWGLGLGW